MHIKITEKGWDSYNGDLGTVQFVNGVSQAPISRQEALRLGAFITVVEIDKDGNELGQVSPALDALRSTKVTVTPTAGLERVSTKTSAGSDVEQYGAVLNDDPILAARASQHANEAAGRATAEAVATAPVASAVKHTAESLEAIATSKGIAGLREIAAPLNVKHTSVKGLMSEILAAQEKAQ